MAADVPDGWTDGLATFVRTFPKTLVEVDRMLTRNAIWVGRFLGEGALAATSNANLIMFRHMDAREHAEHLALVEHVDAAPLQPVDRDGQVVGDLVQRLGRRGVHVLDQEVGTRRGHHRQV